jgi:hypothetical protein
LSYKLSPYWSLMSEFKMYKVWQSY